uniref:LysR family transcriptional regulator n=1 Tax=Haemonchus placei TaxID=6290 RepID=A0A0N4WFJ0_HAEPC
LEKRSVLFFRECVLNNDSANLKWLKEESCTTLASFEAFIPTIPNKQ